MKDFILAADVGGTNIRTALLNSEGDILKSLKRPTLAYKGKDAVINRLVQMLHDTLKDSNVSMVRVKGIGIGFPGPLDIKTGTVFNPPNLMGWQVVVLKDILEQELGKSVVLENDANAAALGEFWKGAGRGTNSLVCLTLGTGVGGGVVLEGKVWHGAKGIAGEIGHTTMVKNGRKCGCGNRGCLEAYCGSSGIITTLKELLERNHLKPKEVITLEKIDEWARQGDQIAQKAIRQTGITLGICIANVANLLNPEMIVLSGGITNLGERLFYPIHQEVKKRALPRATEGLKIVKAELGDYAGIIGAARSLLLTIG